MTATDGEVWSRLTAIIRETFEADEIPITRETTAHDVPAWDSLSNIELIVELEAAFDVTFNTGEMAGLENVGELADVITARLSEKG